MPKLDTNIKLVIYRETANGEEIGVTKNFIITSDPTEVELKKAIRAQIKRIMENGLFFEPDDPTNTLLFSYEYWPGDEIVRITSDVESIACPLNFKCDVCNSAEGCFGLDADE